MSLATYDTDFPADSVEFCPHPLAQNILACGTYRLTEERTSDGKQLRLGKCLVFDTAMDDISKLQEFSLPAVLDMKWCHASPSSPPVLSIADSEGGISLHQWSFTENTLSKFARVRCASSDILCLSLDWSNRRYLSDHLGSLIVSLSDGSLSLLRPNETELLKSDSWHAHDFEPWIAAWDYWDTNIIFSGGDDLKLKGWDIRQGFDSPTFVNKRFDAGVTTIQSHPYVEHIIAVGSYDNTVRLFDKRKLLVPLMQADVGGGAWRVKWHPSEKRKNDLLVACMHDGFKIVSFSPESFGGNNTEHTITKRFDEHESLAYGVDWSFAKDKKDTLIASCSFYDHALRLWRG